MEKKQTERLVGIAMLIAMIVILQFVGSSIPSFSGVSISLVLIPIIIGAIYSGPYGGAILGGAFALITIVNCISGADVGGAMVFQANPALCILVVSAKSILCGLAAAWVYKLLVNKNRYLAIICAAIVCPVVNTGIFVVCMMLFFKPVLAAWAGGTDIIAYILSGLVLCNFLPELIINVVLAPAISKVLDVVGKQMKL